MIKYEANWWWEPRIKKIEVERETDQFVYINGSRTSKETSTSKLFDTFEDAKRRLIYICEKEFEKAEANYNRKFDELKSVRALKDEGGQ